MKPSDSEAPRSETIVAALIYLMTHYARTGCPRLALCVARHIECVSAHPDAAPVIRQVGAGLHAAWTECAGADAPRGAVH